MGNKNIEQKCLEMVVSSPALNEYAKSIKQLIVGKHIQEERPDFLFGRVGIEHFLADVIFTKRDEVTMSIERKNNASIRKRVADYQQRPNELMEDVSNGKAERFVEDVINSEINGVSSFSCWSFYQNFVKVFSDHYSKRSEYRLKCDKLGFLIEMPFPNSLGRGYILNKNGRVYKQVLNSLPIMRELLEYIKSNADLDFVVLCLRPIHDIKSRKGVHSIYINPKDVYGSIMGQRVFICDSFDYPQKFVNDDVFKLVIESSSD